VGDRPPASGGAPIESGVEAEVGSTAAGARLEAKAAANGPARVSVPAAAVALHGISVSNTPEPAASLLQESPRVEHFAGLEHQSTPFLRAELRREDR